MELLAVKRAILIAIMSIDELNPQGRPIAHDFMKRFIERYSFVKFPQTADEILDPKGDGIIFESGRLGDVSIDRLALFNWGVGVDTSASTEASEAVLQDILTWGAETYGLSNRPSLVTRRSYLSEIIFHSDIALPIIDRRLQAVGEKVTGLLSEYLGSPSMPFEIGGLHWYFDSSQSKQIFTPFRIERVAETPFSEKKYYSAAPLKTSDHLQVIGDFETALMLG